MLESTVEYLQTLLISDDIVSCTVCLYSRFNLSNRDIENLLAERGVTVRYEAIRPWCIKFDAVYARRFKQNHRGYGDAFYIDALFVKTNSKQHCLWRAVDRDGEVVDVYLPAKRDGLLESGCSVDR